MCIRDRYFNREVQAVRKKGENTRGYSIEISNDLERARYVQGQALKAYEKGFISYQSSKASAIGKQEGRSRTAGRGSMLGLLRAQGTLEGSVRNEFGINMQRRYRARLAKLQNAQAKTINAVGVRPEYGAPVLMPPTDRLSGALQIASQVASIASGFGGFKLPGMGGADKAVDAVDRTGKATYTSMIDPTFGHTIRTFD